MVGLLSYQKSVLDAGEKVGLIVGDGGIEMVKLVSSGSGNKVILVQNSVGEVIEQELAK